MQTIKPGKRRTFFIKSLLKKGRMIAEKKAIVFMLVYRGEEYPVLVNRNQYPSLMALIFDRLAISGSDCVAAGEVAELVWWKFRKEGSL